MASSALTSTTSSAPTKSASRKCLSDIPDDVWQTILSLCGSEDIQIHTAVNLCIVSPSLKSLLIPIATNLQIVSSESLKHFGKDANGAEKLSTLFKHTTSLRSAALYDMGYGVNGKCINALVTSAINSLQFVNLSRAVIQDSSLKPLLQCPRLNTLICVDVEGITGSAFRNSRAPIQHLNLSQCQSITKEGLQEVFDLTSIKYLNLDFVYANISLSRFVMDVLPTSALAKTLESISLKDCDIDADESLMILRAMPSLKQIVISECNFFEQSPLNFECIENFEALFPNVIFQL